MMIVAHRGYTAAHPENTLSAFQAAHEHGSDAVELDVHLTSDGQLVVHHDYYLGNPDNGEGLIFQKGIAYLKRLRIGNHETIPTLQEVFELVGTNMRYELELKGFGEAFLQAVIATVKRYGLESQVEFTSPHPYMLSRLKQLEPNWRMGIFLAPYPSWMGAQLGHALAVQNAVLGNADVLHCPLDIVDEALVQLAHQNHLLVHAADCNTEAELRRALDVGVDQLSTNELELALRVRASPGV